jgi:pimeloyl-ACP methyl ester carboxylesterase
MFDALGRMREPLADAAHPERLTGFPRLKTADSDAYIDRIVAAVRARKQVEKHVKLLFFFHGGLNTRSGALQRAGEHIAKMFADRPDLYPIFVNWQTSLYASYKDHLLAIHKGHEALGVVGPALAPAQLTTDVARALFESPVAAYLHYADRYRSWAYKMEPIAPVAEQCEPRLDFREGTIKTAHTPVLRDVAQSALLIPFTILGSGLLDAAGSSAWGSMIYTSDRLYYNPQEMHHPYDFNPNESGSGGLSRFLERLVPTLDAGDEIIVVAHSAGAVVANKMIANFAHKLPIRTLVYMAPACTIDELMAGGKLAQFLQQDRTRLYILTLHEKTEYEESNALGLAPRGTLLVWLDEFIQPKSSEFTGMMLGRARNLRLHAHLIPCAIQKRVTITAFHDDSAANMTEQAQRHGGFGDLPYWKESAWRPDIPGLEQVCLSRTPGVCGRISGSGAGNPAPATPAPAAQQ